MVILLLSFLVPTICVCMQTPIKFSDETNRKMQRDIFRIIRRIPRSQVRGYTFQIYSSFSSELKTPFSMTGEYQEIEALLNALYTNIFKDLLSIYRIKSAHKEVPYDEIKKDCKRLITNEITKQTTICFPEGAPDESNYLYMKSFLLKNQNLLLQYYKTAFFYDNLNFSLFSNNESRDLKLTIFALAYSDQLIEEIKNAVNKNSCRQLFSSPTLFEEKNNEI